MTRICRVGRDWRPLTGEAGEASGGAELVVIVCFLNRLGAHPA